MQKTSEVMNHITNEFMRALDVYVYYMIEANKADANEQSITALAKATTHLREQVKNLIR